MRCGNLTYHHCHPSTNRCSKIYVQFQNKLLSLFGLIDRKIYQSHGYSPVNCNRRFWKAKKVYDFCYVGQYSLHCIQNFFHLQSQLSRVGFRKGAFTYDVFGVFFTNLSTLIRYFSIEAYLVKSDSAWPTYLPKNLMWYVNAP